MNSNITKISKHQGSTWIFLWKLAFRGGALYQLIETVQQIRNGAEPSTPFHLGLSIMFFLFATDNVVSLRNELHQPVSIKTVRSTPMWFAILAMTSYICHGVAAVWSFF